MKEMLKKFKGNFKNYFDYLMTVSFGDLFRNVFVLFCILLLSTFVFVPIELVGSLIRDFVLLFGNLPTIVLAIFDWIILLISTVLAFLSFIYLFNRRFEDIESFKKQLITKASGEIKKNEEEEIILPKTKNSK